MSKGFTYNVDIDANIKALMGKLNTLKASLESVTKDGKEPKITKVLEQIETKIDNLRTKAATPIKSEVAFASMQKELQGIDKSLKSVGESVDKIQKESLLPPDTAKKVIDAKKLLDTYNKAIEDSTKESKELTDARKKLASEEGKLDRARKKLVATGQSAKNAAGERDRAKIALEEAKARKDAANAAQEQLQKIQKLAEVQKKENPKLDLRSAKFDDGAGGQITLASARAQAKRTAEASAADDIQALSDSYKSAKQTADTFTIAIGTQTANIEKSQTNVQLATEQVNELSASFETDKVNASAKAFNDFKKGAKDLGISLKGVGLDDTAKNVQQLKSNTQQYIDETLEPATQKTDEVKTSLQAFREEVEHTNGAVEQSTEDFKQQNEAAGQVNSLVDRIKQFTGLAGAAVVMRRALSNAIGTIKDLDKQMTEMAVVTDLRVGDYWKQLPEHTEQANALGIAIKDVYEAETLYYQQGLKSAQVQKLSTSTLKMARIAGLSAEDATNKMTAALRGFNMEINETNADRVADVYSKLAAITASNVKEISSAMTKTASLAANAGMEFETTAAFLSQIIETTRESAETAGTALKTVIARFQELKKAPEEIGEIDGEIVDANKIETALRTVGVALRDASGQFRDLDDVFLELSSRWDTLDTNTQRYIATIAAGSRQQSRFIAMMSDYKRTQELVQAANNASGASTEQFNKTLDSLESKLAALKNAWDSFTMGLTNNQFVKGAVSILTGILNVVNKITKGFGPWSGSALKIGLVTASLVAGGKAIKIFKDKLDDTHSVVKSIGAVFKKTKESLSSFVKKLGDTPKTFKKFIENEKALSEAHKTAKENAKGAGNAIKTKAEETAKDATITDMAAKSTEAKVDVETIDTAETLEGAAASGVSAGATKVENKAKDELTDTEKDELRVAGAKLGLTPEEIEARIAAAGATKLENEAKEEGTKQTKKGFAATLKDIAAKIASKFATDGQTASQIALNLTMGVTLGILLAVIAAIAILVVAIWGIVEAFKQMAKETPEGKLKAAEEALKNTTEQAQLASEAYKDLKESYQDLTDKYKELDELTVGTQEWNSALLEVNAQVTELLEEFPELIKYAQMDSNGVWRLNPKGVREVEQERARGVAEANNAVLAETIRKSQAQIDVDYSKLSADAVAGQEGADAFLGSRGGVIAGVLGMMNPLIGMLIGGSVGAARHGFGSGTSWVDAVSALNPVTGGIRGAIEGREASREAYRQQTEAVAQKLTEIGLTENTTEEQLKNAIKDALGNDIDEITLNQWLKTLAKDSNAAAIELEKYARAQKAADIERNKAYQGMISNSLTLIDTTKYSREQVSQLSGLGSEMMEQFFTSAKAELKMQSDFRKDKEYLKYYEGIYGKGNVKVNRDGSIEVTDDNGKKIKHDREESITNFAASRASQTYATNAEKLVKTLTGTTTGINHLFTNEEGFGLTSEDLTTLTSDALEKYYKQNEDVLDEIYGSYDAFWTAMDARAKTARKQDETNKEALEEIGMKDFSFQPSLSMQAQKGLIQEMKRIVALSGPEAGKQLGNQINAILEGLNSEDAEKFASYLNSIDQSDADALEDLPTQLKQLGINIPEDSLNTFIQEAKDLGQAVHKIDLTKLNESLLDLANILKNIRTGQQGQIFDNDAYEVLIAKDSSLASQFVQNLDGSFTYLGDSLDELVNRINKKSDELVQESIDIANNKIGVATITERIGANNPQYSLSNIGFQDSNTQRQYISQVIAQANAQGVDLRGVSKSGLISNKTTLNALKRMTDEEIESIISDFKNINVAELVNETSRLQVESVVKTRLDEGVYENARFIGVTDDKTRQGTTAAMISQAATAGVSEQELAKLKQLHQELTAIEEDSEKLDPKEYAEKMRELEDEQRRIGKLAGYATMYQGLEETVNQTAELLKTYQDTTSALRKEQLVDQMVASFGIDATKENYDDLAKFTEEYLLGNEQAFESLINYAGESSGIVLSKSESLYAKLNNKTMAEIDAMGSEYTEFVKKMRDSSYGWIDSVTGKFVFASQEIAELGANALEAWINPYDWFYNMSEKHNDILRERNRLEREYSLLIREDSDTYYGAQDGNLEKQLSILQEEWNNQRAVAEGARELLRSLKDDDDRFKPFEDLITFTENGDGLQVHIDDAAYDSNEGSALEGLVSEIHGLMDTMNDATDAANDAQDGVIELLSRTQEAYKDLLNRTADALRKERQDELDAMSSINDAINDAASQLTSKIQEKIDDDRRAREDEKMREDLENKQTRLAYLQASGGSALDILKLQQEIDNDTQTYQDRLVDNAVSEMEKSNQQAADQRQQQIDIAQAQFDWWSEHDAVHDAEKQLEYVLSMHEREREEALRSLLSTTENWAALSEQEQAARLREFRSALVLASNMKEAEEVFNKLIPNTESPVTVDGIGDKLDDIFEKVKIIANKVAPESTSDDDGNTGKDNNDRLYLHSAPVVETLDIRTIDDLHKRFGTRLRMYASGGLADFTGPAWVDGTKSAPELVLNSTDTQNFITLKDILSDVMRNTSDRSSTTYGNNYYDIEVSVDSIDSNYGVDQAVDRIKELIEADAMYRNVNAVQRTR